MKLIKWAVLLVILPMFTGCVSRLGVRDPAYDKALNMSIMDSVIQGRKDANLTYRALIQANEVYLKKIKDVIGKHKCQSGAK